MTPTIHRLMLSASRSYGSSGHDGGGGGDVVGGGGMEVVMMVAVEAVAVSGG